MIPPFQTASNLGHYSPPHSAPARPYLCVEQGIGVGAAAGFQAALPALAVVLVLLFAGGFKAETGFDGQQGGAKNYLR
ncbi:hypothetical protein HMPREF2606_03995 [Neisseria sp. HMSC070H10]|uniref:hypothetical protein n=1 Tax=unclassified Neisseria TaxID=2623750 RepID=UPI0004D1F7DE|nr:MULTISPECIES: hypothetical protein [unclassified Neisseria]AIE44063.1 hypothetical protein [uncultured bacterium]OFM98204.1 hypothetical protein HMPREF2633_07545 [Neisseria sp. HMSC072C05]OHQ55889.1 hypothetical protein HMPREF2606_03995 [Neisseria sp. HMSC070H10]